MKPLKLSGVEPGPISKFFSAAGHVVDAVTNIGGIAVEFKRDYDRGDFEYTNTQKEVVISGAQLITSAAVGAGVTALTGVFAGAMVTASVPVVVGIAAGIGAGYLIGKGADYIRGIWKDL